MPASLLALWENGHCMLPWKPRTMMIGDSEPSNPRRCETRVNRLVRSRRKLNTVNWRSDSILTSRTCSWHGAGVWRPLAICSLAQSVKSNTLASRAARLAELRALRAAGKTAAATYVVEEDTQLFDEVDDNDYKNIVRKRLD